ncbi:hypothetical protein Taro_054778 [Colocasia esculenta]|uniref:Pectinesterase n=1 Tax=Colocasia esculenta TaxID=4460 RepID=A0A843XRE1_COLES|nr:hypothetical protein [Colocasia esculenta]
MSPRLPISIQVSTAGNSPSPSPLYRRDLTRQWPPRGAIEREVGQGKAREIDRDIHQQTSTMMDSIKSFKGYGKVDGADEREFRRKTRRRLIVIGVSALLLILIVVGVAVGVVLSRRSDGGSNGPSSASSLTMAQSIKAVCSVTRYPVNCYSSLSAASANATSDPEDLFKLSLRVSMDELSRISSLPDALSKGLSDKRAADALQVCKDMFDDALDHLNNSLSSFRPTAGEKLLTAFKVDNLRSWLSAAVTDQETCLDAFEGVAGDLRDRLAAAMRNSTRFTSNSLAIASGILGVLGQLNIPLHRKLLSAADHAGMPAWVAGTHRRMLLQAAGSGTRPTPNVTVAKDGSGQVETIAAAVAMAPKKSAAPFVIYVKEGTYVENVVIDKNRWNVVIYGDGMRKSVVSGSLNFVDGTRTFYTATFGADGRGFMAMDMGFENSAGAAKHQAVALRSKSDRAVFYRCAFDGYQDTLYAHSLRQFYRDCEISGTVDFIFGDASAVFQSCTIRPRQPLPNQQNTITAQGRVDPGENTGISIQGCTITPEGAVTAPTYLGRPWKNYSTTVVMTTAVDGVVRPKGWLEWVSGTAPPDTIYYGEYQNTGPGASTEGRVNWAGYKPAMTDEEAQKYAVEAFIKGSEWIPNTGVAYKLTL